MTSEKLMAYRQISKTFCEDITIEYDYKTFQGILKDSKRLNPILYFSPGRIKDLEASALLGCLKSHEEYCGKVSTGIDAIPRD